ncbi:MAG: hypothetical protein IJM30_11385 [Thermoguttaceae bacterium]|nr:hypothetical protein [Thermoguttaceae bacterium]
MKYRFTTTCFLIAFFIVSFATLSRADEPFEKASVAFRISPAIWADDARFEQLLDLFEKYPEATDEVTYFTQTIHSPVTDDELARRCVVLKDRIAKTRARGFRAGINLLCTFGHHPEDLPHSIGPEFPRAMTIDGTIAQGTLCANQEIFKERIKRIFTDLANADPDYIWIDDDVRTWHMLDSAGSAGSLCYCDECMKLISEKLGKETTREELRNVLADPKILAKVREATSDSYDRLFALIEKTVHGLKPDMPLGFMTGERYDEGYDFARWATALSGPNRDKEVYWRPGGGFYDQSYMDGLFGKSHEIGRQIALLPASVRVIQSEIENFPYQPLAKSASVTTLEAVSHIAAGCTGAAFNVLTMNDEPLDEYEPMIATIASRREFFNLAVQKLGRAPNVGVLPLWMKNDGNWAYRIPVQNLTCGISDVGIPIAYDWTKKDADVYLMSRPFVDHNPPETIKEYFKQGVYTDNDALGLLNDPGTYALNDLTGMEYKDVVTVDGIEKFEPNPLNGKFAGRTRDLRQSFWREPIISLAKTREGVETLSSCVDYGNETKAETIVGIYENPLGGRVCVNGYFPWSNILNYPKQSQIRAIMRWLSKDRLLGYVDSFAKVHLWLRQPNEKGQFAGIAINSTYDPATNLAIMLKTEKNSISVYGYSCERQVVEASETDGSGYKRFVIPEIKAWEPALIVVE